MSQTHAHCIRTRTSGEELANSISHGCGLIAALIATRILLLAAARHGDPVSVLSTGIFGVTMVMVFLASTLYHALPTGRAKRVFEYLDNAAVFLLIAGTYTPFTLTVLRGTWGWSLLVVVWLLAVAGVLLIAVGGLRFPVLSACLCLVMGWMVLIVLPPLEQHLPRPGLMLIVAGGIAYTSGLAFFAAQRLPYHHLVWHIFVLFGTGCHFMAVLWYAT